MACCGTEKFAATSAKIGRPVRFDWGLLSCCFLWLVTRALALCWQDPRFLWEVWEAKKLLDYGFWDRSGAILHQFWMTGIVADPSKFNYTHHPYPVLWLYTLAYYVGGAN